MANPDSVGQNTQDYFSNYLLAIAGPVSIAATGNAVVALPILRGGTGGTTKYIVRRITVCNPSNTAGGSVPNVAAANVSIGQTNDGANLVTSNTVLTNMTGANTFVDLTLAASANSTEYSANALFLNVNGAVANTAVFVKVWGEVVTY
jgi:hypothetical protein